MSIGGASNAASLWGAAKTTAPASTETAPQGDRFMAYLTPADKELVFQATGKKVDSSTRLVPMFAVMVGMQRKNGGEVDESFVKAQRAHSAGTTDADGATGWLASLDRALDYLGANKPGSGRVNLLG